MVGVSYGGISQLFVAATDPPDLAAIAPLSVIDNTATTLYPGGILNTGFAAAVRTSARLRRRAGLARSRRGVGASADPRRRSRVPRPIRCSTPRRSTRWPRSPPTATTSRRSPNPLNPTTFVHKIQRAGVPGLPVDRRADRRPLPRARRALHGYSAEVVHVHERRPHRLARSGRPRCAGTTSCRCSWRGRLPRSVAGHASARAAALPDGDGDQRGAVPRRRSDRGRARLRIRARGVRAPAGGPHPVRQRRRRRRGRARPVAAFEQSFARFPLPGTRAVSW